MDDAEKDRMVNTFLTLMRSEFLTKNEKEMLDEAMNDFRTEQNRVNDMVSSYFMTHNVRKMIELEKRIENHG